MILINTMEQYKNHVVSVRVRGYEAVNGILLDAAEHWVVVKHIPNDYVVDGLLLINAKYVLSIGDGKWDGLTERVLRLKKVDFEEKHSVNLSSNQAAYNYLLSSRHLVQISLGDESAVYIGRVIKVNDNSFRCQMLSVKGEWDNEQSFKYDSVRMLGLHNDYVESLTLLVNSEE